VCWAVPFAIVWIIRNFAFLVGEMTLGFETDSLLLLQMMIGPKVVPRPWSSREKPHPSRGVVRRMEIPNPLLCKGCPRNTTPWRRLRNVKLHVLYVSYLWSRWKFARSSSSSAILLPDWFGPRAHVMHVEREEIPAPGPNQTPGNRFQLLYRRSCYSARY
jgi:hypothetical protein